MSCDEAKRSIPVAPPAKPTFERKEPVLSRPEGRKSAEMKDELQKEAVDIAIAVGAFEKNSVEKVVAEHRNLIRGIWSYLGIALWVGTSALM